MLRTVSVLIMTVFCIFPGVLNAVQVNSTWIGPWGGSWGNPDNWNPNIVPNNNETQKFVVTIDGDDCAIAIDGDFVINKLDCDCDWLRLDFEYWNFTHLTLVDPNGITNKGVLNIEGDSNYDISGNITNTDGAELILEDLEITGNLFNSAEGLINIKGNVDFDNGGLENSGLIIIVQNSDFHIDEYFHNVGEILIYSGSCGSPILDNESPGIIKGFGHVRTESFINTGEIYAHGGSLALIIYSERIYSEIPVINNGIIHNANLTSVNLIQVEQPTKVNNFNTIEVKAGGGMAFDPNLFNEPSASIKLLGGVLAAPTIIQAADASFQGQGDIDGNVVIKSDGIITLTGPSNIFGDVVIEPNATLEISDGTTIVTGHVENNGTIHMKGGYIIPQGGFTDNGNVIWEPGLYNNIADFNLDGEVNLPDFANFASTWLWKTSWR